MRVTSYGSKINMHGCKSQYNYNSFRPWPAVTMTSTLSRTNSAAISAKRSLRPSPTILDRTVWPDPQQSRSRFPLPWLASGPPAAIQVSEKRSAHFHFVRVSLNITKDTRADQRCGALGLDVPASRRAGDQLRHPSSQPFFYVE
jgi:hypothetical protein